jgi:hypothetical protein
MYILQGKTRPTCHTLSTLSPCMVQDHTYLMRSTYSNLSHSRQQIWIDPLLLRRRAPDTTPARLSDSWVRTQLLSWTNHWSSEEKSSFCWPPTTRPIKTSMRSVCSILARGANPLVLNRLRWGLQPWRCRLSTYHSLTFPTDGLHFPPKGPARSPV